MLSNILSNISRNIKFTANNKYFLKAFTNNIPLHSNTFIKTQSKNY